MTGSPNGSLRNRIRFLYLCVFLFGLIAFVRLFYLQILHGSDYRDLADRQYSQPVTNLFNRGSIYFTEKNGNLLSAATLKTTYFLALSPKVIVDPAGACAKIGEILGVENSACLAKATKKDDPYEVLGRGYSEEDANRITDEKMLGVTMYKENNRIYPAGQLAANLLGFVGFGKESGAFPVGRYGVEKKFDDVLTRSFDGVSTNFFAELFGNIKDTIAGDLHPEGDVVLTIEPSVQGHLEKALFDVKEKWQAESAGGVVIEPSTGKIIAMASLPTYDPNQFSKEKNQAVFGNPITESVFEMGSIVKPLTMGAGIDAGVVTRKSTYDDKGSVVLNGKKISNFDGKARGVIPMQEVLNQSLNVGSVYIMQKLGAENFSTYMRAYGLGEQTGIDLPSEQAGLIKNLSSDYEVDRATAAFGQGIAITPIEVTRALSTLANGGVLMKPYLVDKIVYKSGLEKKTEPVPQGRVLKESTAATVSDMLTEVVDTKLANGKAKMDHYSVAAKTGTAQIANPATGKYYDDRYLHSFFGYFPKDHARYLTFLYIVHPKGVQYSSETLTEPFLDMTKYLIQYYNIPPDR